MMSTKYFSRSVSALITLSALLISVGTAVSARGQAVGPIQPEFFGLSVNNPPAAPWPSTLSVPFSSWRTLGVEVKWSDIEQCDGGSNPTNSCYVWTTLDSSISQAQGSGQSILYTIDSTPTWASSEPDDKTCARASFPAGSCDPPNDIDAVPGSGLGDGTNLHFDDFMNAMMSHLGPGVIKYWEVWDEPNVAHSWKGTNDQLLRLAKDTQSIVKGLDPNALITTPAYVGEGIGLQLPTYLANGGGQYADIIAYHGYVQTGTCPNDCPIPENEAALISELQGELQTAGQVGKPVFDTEASWGNYLGTDAISDPDQQAAFTGRYYLMHVSGGVNTIYWYSWNNQENGHFYDTTTDAIIPAGTAYQQLYNWLVGNTLTAPCAEFGTQWICTFVGPSSYAAEALWDVDSTLVCSGGVCPTVNVSVPTNFTQYSNLAGSVTPISNETVPVGSKPILVQGVTPNISVTASVSPTVTSIGAMITYSIVVINNTLQAINNVSVSDNLTSTLGFSSCSSSPNGVCQNTGNNVTVTFSSLASGSKDTITIAATVLSSAAGTIVNTVTANWISASGIASDNWATVGVVVGTPGASVSPTSINFGNQTVDVTSAPKNVVITNTGTGNLILSNIGTTGGDSTDFTFTSSPLPITVTPKSKTAIGISFTPGALGKRSGSLYVYNNTSSTLTVSLGGNGAYSTTTTLSSSANPVLQGQSVTFTASVTCTSSVAPTGTVTFKDVNTVMGTVTLSSSGTASYSTSSLPIGWQTITATYSGDVNCGGSQESISQGVKLPTAVALNSSLNPSTYGQAVTFTATVTSSGGGTPSGSVTFKNGGATLGSSVLNGSGVATYTTSTLTKAVHSITAVYGGNATYITSTSPVLTQTVNGNAAPTVSSIASSSGPATGGTAVTITGTGFQSGATVTFGGTAATNVTVVSSTSITATTPAHAAGAVNVVVSDSGGSGTLTNGFTYTATMGIGFVQVASATPQSSQTSVLVSYPQAQTAGDLNLVVVGWNDTSATVQSVTDSVGNSYALAAGPLTGTALTQSIYYAKNILAASNSVTVTFSKAAASPDVRILEYKGLNTTAPLDVTAGASGTSGSNATVSSGSATTTSANELILGAGITNGAFSTAGTSFKAEVITADGDIAEDEVVSATGSYSATASLGAYGSQTWIMQMVTLKQ